MKQIQLEIDAAGNVKTIGSTGYGDQCLLSTRDLEAKLGVANEASRELTEDFYNREQTNYAQQAAQ